jgi:hypothetical protein
MFPHPGGFNPDDQADDSCDTKFLRTGIGQNLSEGLKMKMFDSWWARLTPAHVRVVVGLVSILAMVLTGAADDFWG